MKKSEKISVDLCLKNIDFESQKLVLFKTRNYLNSRNTTISFDYTEFLPKIYLILYPSLENSATLITILRRVMPNL